MSTYVHASPPDLSDVKWQDLGLDLSESYPVRVYLFGFDEPCPVSYDMHYALELGVALSGRTRRYVGPWAAEVGAGEVWLCGTWEPHGWEVLEAPCQHLVCVILPQALLTPVPGEGPHREWLAPFSAPPEQRPQARPGSRAEMLALARQALEKRSLDEPLNWLWMRLLVFDMLLFLLQDWTVVPPLAGPRRYLHEVLRSALELVLPARGLITVEEAARRCGVSSSTLARAFRQFMGMSFAHFALRHRLHQAAVQLVRTRDPIKAVAADWGFTDDSHLHRCFLRHYGCPPGRHRQAWRPGKTAEGRGVIAAGVGSSMAGARSAP